MKPLQLIMKNNIEFDELVRRRGGGGGGGGGLVNNIFYGWTKFSGDGVFILKYSTTPLSRTLKGPKKMVRLNGSLTYPNFTLSQTK